MHNLPSSLKNFDIKFNQPLAPYTTWKIGGPAEMLLQLNSSQDLEKVINICQDNNIPFTLLGWASNVLISDEGLKGLTIINRSKKWSILENTTSTTNVNKNPYIQHRHTDTKDPNYYSFADLDFREEGEGEFVKFDSGVFLPWAINKTLAAGLSGLQWFAGIPGTMGGSLYNNIHGGTRHLSEYFLEAEILTLNGQKKIVNYDFFEFGYDTSKLRQEYFSILTVTLSLIKTKDIQKSIDVATEWARRKRLQPKKSCGSVFQALPEEVVARKNYPTPSAGYVIDKILDRKGYTVGGAQVSKKHANFIENINEAKAVDVVSIITTLKKEALEKAGVSFIPEINFLGFNEDLTKNLKN